MSSPEPIPFAPKKKLGRPRVGDGTIEVTLPQGVLAELLRLEKETGRSRTCIARELLVNGLERFEELAHVTQKLRLGSEADQGSAYRETVHSETARV
jgi:predicted DNA-binding protein